jgi:hypothetical protein
MCQCGSHQFSQLNQAQRFNSNRTCHCQSCWNQFTQRQFRHGSCCCPSHADNCGCGVRVLMPLRNRHEICEMELEELRELIKEILEDIKEEKHRKKKKNKD